MLKTTKRHPVCPDLVVEVSLTTLEFDRGRKGQLYASAEIPDYWIINLVDSCLEVYRAPKAGSHGWVYGERKVLLKDEKVAPLMLAPPIPVAALFDWPR